MTLTAASMGWNFLPSSWRTFGLKFISCRMIWAHGGRRHFSLIRIQFTRLRRQQRTRWVELMKYNVYMSCLASSLIHKRFRIGLLLIPHKWFIDLSHITIEEFIINIFWYLRGAGKRREREAFASFCCCLFVLLPPSSPSSHPILSQTTSTHNSHLFSFFISFLSFLSFFHLHLESRL